MNDVNMLLLGDTNVGRPDPDSAFASALHLIRDADIRFCNLETVVADSKYLHPYDRSHLPRTEEWMFDAYVQAGFSKRTPYRVDNRGWACSPHNKVL